MEKSHKLSQIVEWNLVKFVSCVQNTRTPQFKTLVSVHFLAFLDVQMEHTGIKKS